MDNGATPLTAIAESFEGLAKLVKSLKNSSQELRLDTLCDACSLVSILFSSLGLAFKFAELEYVSKIANRMKFECHSRNLRRVRQGLDLIRALFEQFMSTDEYSLRDAASTAYTRVCAPYHSWAVRTAVSAGMYTLPTREQLLLKLNETNQSAEKKMRRYINASGPVIEYIDKLYISRKISLDW
uniref:Glycolipid transfer protein domain-containing protein n=1 Tax=Cucumis sativus TaxID=3659 RepID=A0A0A0KWE8_CUCSA